MRFFIIKILLFFLISCKTNENKDLTNKPNLQEGTTETIVSSKTIKQFDIIRRIIFKDEFNIYSNKKFISGDFYNSKTDSLVFFEFHPIIINEKSKALISKIGNFEECDFICKQQNLASNIKIFKTLGYIIDYNYVLEQKDAGGLDVFNVKEPFRAQSFTYKDGIIILGEIKTYIKIEEIYY